MNLFGPFLKYSGRCTNQNLHICDSLIISIGQIYLMVLIHISGRFFKIFKLIKNIHWKKSSNSEFVGIPMYYLFCSNSLSVTNSKQNQNVSIRPNGQGKYSQEFQGPLITIAYVRISVNFHLLGKFISWWPKHIRSLRSAFCSLKHVNNRRIDPKCMCNGVYGHSPRFQSKNFDKLK